MKNYTITVNGVAYSVTVEETGAAPAPAPAPVAAPAPKAPAPALPLRRLPHLRLPPPLPERPEASR